MRKLSLLISLAMLAALPAAAADAKRKRPRLKAFSSCASVVDYGNRNLDRVAPTMRGPVVMPAPMQDQAATGGPPPAAGAPEGAAREGGGTDFSTTNVQEAGVDEPDLVKTDGKTVYAVSDGRLQVVAVDRETPARVGQVKLGGGWDHQMLLHGDRLMVSWSEPPDYRGGPVSQQASSVPGYYQQATILAEVDVSDRAAPRVVRTMKVDGRLVSARLTGGIARLVLESSPDAVAERNAGARDRTSNRRVASWIPRAVTSNRRTGRRVRRNLVRCSSVRRPLTFAGLDLLTVLTIDLEKGLSPIDSDAVMSDAETVYASATGLYVATQRYAAQQVEQRAEVPDDVTTAIHRFDISDPRTTAYRGSGVVRGYLLSQWSLSERDGVLRVASTTMPPWWGGDARSESFVTTLDQRDGRLVELGRLGGLGRGERIYAVRFIDDVGYVVTFRQTDPLYTIDVSNPAQPRVLGELKILGYSAYLHPVGDGLLLGVGQDATEEGRRLGTQLSLFDVSDPAAPRRLHQRALGSDSSSEVESDHKAFLYWAPTRLAVIPVSDYSGEEPFVGAAGFRVDAASGIAAAGRISHPAPNPYAGAIRRSLVAQGRLFTVSDLGLKASSLDGLADQAWVPFN